MSIKNSGSVPDAEEYEGTSGGDLIRSLESLLKIDDIIEIKEHVSGLKSSIENSSGKESSFTGLQVRGIISDLEQILEARERERAVYYINRLIRGISEEKTGKINDINLNRWKEYDDIYTDSLWYLEKRDTSGAHNAAYWGNFIPQIPYQLLNRFTKKGEWVLDAFVGSGTTLIECVRQGRNGVGFDLSDEALKVARDNISREENLHGVRVETVRTDSTHTSFREELATLGLESVQLVIMHPPYWDIINFSDDSNDLSNAPTIELFLEGIRSTAENAHSVLDDGRYLALVIGDKYSRGEWIPLGFRSMDVVLSSGFRLKSIIVKNFDQTRGKQSQKELWRYRALAGGFYVFKHEYIFLFEKTSSK